MCRRAPRAAIPPPLPSLEGLEPVLASSDDRHASDFANRHPFVVFGAHPTPFSCCGGRVLRSLPRCSGRLPPTDCSQTGSPRPCPSAAGGVLPLASLRGKRY